MDSKAKHMFVCSDVHVSEKNEYYMFANVVGEFNNQSHQYECVTKLALVNKGDLIKIQQYQKNDGLFASNKKKEVLYELLLKAGEDSGKLEDLTDQNGISDKS